MRKFSIALLALISFLALNAKETILKGSAANEKIKGTELIRYKEGVNNPAFIRFKANEGPSVTDVANWITENFAWPQGYSIEVNKVEEDKFGFSHISFLQYYNGIRVEFAVVKAHALGTKVVSINGASASVASAGRHELSEELGLKSALGKIDAEIYKWEIPEEEALLKAETKNAEATYFPKGEKVFFPSNLSFSTNQIVPCWKYNVYAVEPLYRADIYVNAETGEILFENLDIKHVDSLGTAETSFSGTQTITADYTGNGAFRLRESGRGNGVETYDMLNGTSHAAAVDLIDSTNTWPDTLRLSYGTDAHWGAENVYDYYLANHGRNSIDGNGFTLKSYVHYSVNYSNAFWDGQRMTYGDGNGSSLPYTTLDIAGHEISHGLTNFTAGLVYSYESGALNESFSDIFGCAAEIYGKPSATNNWLMGEERGSYIRSMSNPKARQDPDTYYGSYWYTGTADNGGVHTNSGVQNHWFYLLSQGGIGVNDNNDNFNVVGLGIAKAEAIAFRNLTVYLTANSDYEDARFYAIESAIDLYGKCSPELASTVNAWYAVGLGDPYVPSVVSDFSANMLEFCELPANVTFSNLSNYNANTYLWEFGDNTTSTQQNPFHSYNSIGTFTVKLTAVGDSACGSDVESKTGYIVVAPPADAVAPNILSCDGEPALVTATSNDSVYWYTDMVTNTPFHKGYSLVTAPLFSDTTFYVESVIVGQDENAGPSSNNIGSGGFYSGYQYLIFDVYKPIKLKSVKVYADGAAYRGIELRNSNGTQLLSKLVNIGDGTQVVQLDFTIAPGTNYQLGTTATPAPNLYRNSSGPNYPYTIPGTLSIKSSSAQTDPYGYYYFFYDWVIEGSDCFGNRLPVKVTMDFDANCEPFYQGVDETVSLNEFNLFPNPSQGSFNISFDLAKSEQIAVKVIDARGAVLDTKASENFSPGTHLITWDGSHLSKGLYVIQLETASSTFVKRLVIE